MEPTRTTAPGGRLGAPDRFQQVRPTPTPPLPHRTSDPSPAGPDVGDDFSFLEGLPGPPGLPGIPKRRISVQTLCIPWTPVAKCSPKRCQRVKNIWSERKSGILGFRAAPGAIAAPWGHMNIISLFRGRESAVLGVWAGLPRGPRRPSREDRGAKPPSFLEGLPGPLARPDLQNDRFPPLLKSTNPSQNAGTVEPFDRHLYLAALCPPVVGSV